MPDSSVPLDAAGGSSDAPMCGMAVGPVHLYMEYCDGGQNANDLCWVTTNDGI